MSHRFHVPETRTFVIQTSAINKDWKGLETVGEVGKATNRTSKHNCQKNSRRFWRRLFDWSIGGVFKLLGCHPMIDEF